ncbi:hypothetical protein C8F04DRAFT_966687, partial [Mycena alexandri]
SVDLLTFGYGRWVCPGRFFPTVQMKGVMAHILMNYDVRAQIEGIRPPNISLWMFVIPHPRGKILLRRRHY